MTIKEINQWQANSDDPTLVGAILDGIVHNAYPLDLSGDPVRKNRYQQKTKKRTYYYDYRIALDRRSCAVIGGRGTGQISKPIVEECSPLIAS